MRSLSLLQVFAGLLLQNVLAATFTPRDMLSVPRLNAVKPNNAGSLGLYSNSTYCFNEHATTKTWHVVDLKTGESKVLFKGKEAFEVTWLGIDDETILYAKSGVNGTTELRVKKYQDTGEGYQALTLPGPASNFKAKGRKDRGVFLAFTGSRTSECDLYNEVTAPKKYSTAMVYESLYVRHWDAYITPEKPSLFSARLIAHGNGTFTAGSSKYICLLKPETNLETDDFKMSADGQFLSFISLDPKLDPARNTASYIYHVAQNGSSGPTAINSPDKYDGFEEVPEGASASPAFSPDGKTLAYLQMDKNGYEADLRKVYIAARGETPRLVFDDRQFSPNGISWSKDGEGLFLSIEHVGRTKLFYLTLNTDEVQTGKDLIWFESEGNLLAMEEIPGDKILLTISSLKTSQRPYTIDLGFNSTAKPVLPLSPEAVALKGVTVEDTWYEGAQTMVHMRVLKPTGFDASKKYPLLFWIHGGPQSSFTDSWSTRWNAATFAEAGFILVEPNFSGSTGYGQDFTDAIQGQWGGYPYRDLELAMEEIENNPDFSYIDTDKMVAMGGSFGGYMVNWINGHPLGRKFKALVNHNGVFSTLSYGTDELFFDDQEFGGVPWGETKGNFEQWDPQSFVENWETPTMIIHSENDYRLPISEGLGAFNALQTVGVPSKFLTFIDENHWVLKPENSLRWHEEVFEWIHRWTKDDVEAHNGKKLAGGMQAMVGNA